MDQGSFREERSSNTGDFNSGGLVAGKKKADFEDISRLEVQLSPPSTTQKLPPQAASPSSRNTDNPAVRRKKKDDTVEDVGV